MPRDTPAGTSYDGNRTAPQAAIFVMRFLPVILPAVMLAALAGCAPDYSPNTYGTNAVQQANKVESAVVVGFRQVKITASGTVGAVSGGAADSSQGASGAAIFSRAAGQGHERTADPYGPPAPRAGAVPPLGGRTGGQVPEPRERWGGGEVAAGAGGPHGMEQSWPFPPAARGQAMPACVMIMWGDGTVTTVHPPEAPPALKEAP